MKRWGTYTLKVLGKRILNDYKSIKYWNEVLRKIHVSKIDHIDNNLKQFSKTYSGSDKFE